MVAERRKRSEEKRAEARQRVAARSAARARVEKQARDAKKQAVRPSVQFIAEPKTVFSKAIINRRTRLRANGAHMRAQFVERVPKWLTRNDRQEIAKVYDEADRLTIQTGVLHHVDHIVPLRGKTVSGLHVPWNLRALPASDNRIKGNKLEVAA